MAASLASRMNSMSLLRKVTSPRVLQNRFLQSLAAYEESLSNVSPTEASTLSSGLRVATESTGGNVCTVGVWMDTGSRFESAEENGVGHFLEHMMYRGTHNRSAAQLEQEVGSIGGSISSFTAREMTAVYGKCLKGDLPQMVDILADMVQNAALNEDDIEKEKGVILKQMQEIDMDKESVTLDHLHTTAYQGTALSNPVFGPSSNVRAMKKDHIQNYIARNISAPRMVIAGAGGVTHAELSRLAEQKFGDLRTSYSSAESLAPSRFTGSDIRVRDDNIPHAHVAIAIESCGLSHADSLAMSLAAVIFGSWNPLLGGKNHTAGNLSQSVNEHKLAVDYHPFFQQYTDTSLWGAYMVSGPLQIEDMIWSVQQEWMRICTSITENELARAKNILKTSILRDLDGTTAVCRDIGHQMLAYERRIPLPELNKRIDEIDTMTLKSTASKYIYDKCIAAAGYGSIEGMTDYNRMRSDTYWLRL